MSNSDKWVFGFITLWIVLTAGKPDLLDAITVRVMGSQCSYDSYQSNIQLDRLEKIRNE